MLCYSKCVFDNTISSTTGVWTGGGLSDELGLYDQLTLHAVADGATGANTLTVDIEHSCDRTWWLTESAAVLSGAITANTVNFYFGNSANNASQQGCAFRRLKVTLSVSSPVHVKIYVVAHDQSVRQPVEDVRGVPR